MSLLSELDQALLLRDTNKLLSIQEKLTNGKFTDDFIQISENDVKEINVIISTCLQLLNGKHIDLLVDTTWIDSNLLKTLHDVNISIEEAQEAVWDYIVSQESELFEYLAILKLLLLGELHMELYLQMNYTGPELSQAELVRGNLFLDNEEIYKRQLTFLESDGVYSFPIIQLPQTLIIARIIFSALAEPLQQCWRHGVTLDINGKVTKKLNENSLCQVIDNILNRSNLNSRYWYHARAAVIHVRTLQLSNYSNVPTMWYECQNAFNTSLQYFATETSDVQLTTQLWLEWGLCQHYFEYQDHGRAVYNKAKAACGLFTQLTGGMGKRTKHQTFDIAQMYLIAESRLIDTAQVDNNSTTKAQPEMQLKERPNYNEPSDDEEEKNPNSWKHAEWELGRRLVGEIDGTGEEAAVREVMLDSIDGGPDENILLEGGPKFTEQIDRGSEVLHPLDQAVILALCLDVKNSNPADGLTNVEMFPFVERVLQQAQNWMIHSTALLQRSWLEYEKRRTFDRALLQIQALLDQHTTKLTITQSTFKSIEDSAPVQDRIRYLHCIVYPAQYELKRDVAGRYLESSVFVSALNYFKELELWDEVVKCYQLLDKPQRAEMVVRERIKLGETPYMVTVLADLTNDESLYERAWTLSNGRFARAKRTLGRICYDTGRFQDAIKHLDQALGVQPLVATAWYLRGIAAMQIAEWDIGIQSFVRCVQQDMEVAEAYANMGAIFMRKKEFQKAYSALKEALKYRSDSWKISENLLTICLALARWRECIVHMERLLDLRAKSNRPVHKQELRHLVHIATSNIFEQITHEAATSSADDESGTSQSAIEKSLLASTAAKDTQSYTQVALINALEAFLKKLVTSLHVDAEIWDIYSEYYELQNKLKEALDTRVRQYRTATNQAGWEKHVLKIREIATIGEKLKAILYKQEELSKSDVYTAKSLFQSTIKKLDIEFYQFKPETVPTDVDESMTILKSLVGNM